MGCEKKYVCILGVSALEACLEFLFPIPCWLNMATTVAAALSLEAEATC